MGEKPKEFTAAFAGKTVIKLPKDEMVGTAITELGGKLTKVEETTEHEENREILEEINPENVIHEDMGGKKVIITENGSQIDQDTGEVILEGSND
jgi:hypothetical protein